MKKSQFRRIAILALILPQLIFVISCRLEVPIREMTQAKTAIGRAIEVKAEKYAPEELKQAETSLLKSHEYISSEDTGKAAEEARESIKNSEAAIAKSLPLLAADSIANAKKEYAEADALYSEKLAPEEFAAAGESLKLAEARMGEQAYWDSHLASLESARQSSAAKTRALGGLPGLRSEIDRIRTESDELKKNRGTEFAPDELAELYKKLTNADEALAGNAIKEAALALAGCDELLASATAKTYEALAKENLAAAETALEKARQAEHAEEFSTEIQSAEALIAEGRTHLENRAFQQSYEKSGEAIAILNAMTIAIEKRAEEERLAGDVKEDVAEKTPATGDIKEDYIQPSVSEYVVKLNPKKRDCLWRISLHVYRDARLWPLIYVANRDRIKDPDLIFPGQKFVIPPVPRKKKHPEGPAAEKDVKKDEEPTAPKEPLENGKNDASVE